MGRFYGDDGFVMEIGIGRLYYNSLLKMKDASSPESDLLPSPERFPNYDKEDAEDRLATRNSLQMTTEEECMEGRINKRRKLQVMLHSQRQNKPTVSIPILEETEPAMTVLPDSLN